MEIAVLPLSGPPDMVLTLRSNLICAGDGIEGAGLDFLDDRIPVDLADPLDRLLQDLRLA